MFSTSERLVFKFHDGQKERAVDPMAVFRRLYGTPGLNLVADVQAFEMLQGHFIKVAKDPKVAESAIGQEVQAKGIAAWDRLLSATRSALGIREFHLDDAGDQAGLTDGEVMQTFLKLLDYLQGLKKNTSASPTSPPTTAPSA